MNENIKIKECIDIDNLSNINKQTNTKNQNSKNQTKIDNNITELIQINDSDSYYTNNYIKIHDFQNINNNKKNHEKLPIYIDSDSDNQYISVQNSNKNFTLNSDNNSSINNENNNCKFIKTENYISKVDNEKKNNKIKSEFLSKNTINDFENNLDKIFEKKLNWTTYFMCMTLLAKERSSCTRLKVGCVIVKNNRVISMGYNGFLPGAPHKSRIRDNHEISTVHAEQNAISDAASRGASIKDSIIYISHFPCINCFKIIVASGIHNIYYHHDYNNDIFINELAIENGIKLIKL